MHRPARAGGTSYNRRMKQMQDVILEHIASAVTAAGLSPTQRARFSNIGAVYGMKGLDTRVRIDYSFQSDYCTIEIFDGSGAPVRKYHYLRYHDADVLREALVTIEDTGKA